MLHTDPIDKQKLPNQESVSVIKKILKDYKHKDLPIDQAVSEILSLTTKPLDEKEVEKVLKTTQVGTYYPMEIKGEAKPEPRTMFVSDYKIDLGGIYKLKKAICSHFSKPNIKYPEKLETCNRNCKHTECNERDIYNQAIDDMRALTEGGSNE